MKPCPKSPHGRIKPRKESDPAHLARVRKLPCCICGQSPSEAHHLKGGMGLGVKASDHETIPLCRIHHRDGGYGIAVHSGWMHWEECHGTQRNFVNATLAKLKEF